MSAAVADRRAWQRLLWVAARVILLLAAVDWCMANIFLRRVLVARYATPFSILRDRTNGAATSILFELLERVPDPDVRVAFVGDSTMHPGEVFDQLFVPYLVGRDLQSRFPTLSIESVDASVLGLYASSAALFVSKLLGRDTDVIVYGVTPRAFPARPKSAWVGSVSGELGPGDLARIARTGGGPWLLRNLSTEDLLAGLVKSQWQTLAHRAPLRAYLGEAILTRAPIAVPAGAAPAQATNQRAPAAYEWTRADYAPPNANWDALHVIGALCRTYAPGRCVLYASPINPLLREKLYEPGLYDQYLAELRIAAGRYGLIYRDYTDALGPADFRKPVYGGVRDPIHMNPEGHGKLARLLMDPLTRAIELAAANESRDAPPGGAEAGPS